MNYVVKSFIRICPVVDEILTNRPQSRQVWIRSGSHGAVMACFNWSSVVWPLLGPHLMNHAGTLCGPELGHMNLALWKG